RLNAKPVVPAAEVLNEGVPGDDNCRRPVRIEAAHRAEARLQPAVVGLDAVVGVRVDVVEGPREEVVHHPDVARRLVGDDLDGSDPAMWPGPKRGTGR